MKLAFVLAFLCVIAVGFAAKEQNDGYPEHSVKKYEKERHHHHHKKHKTIEATDEKKYGTHKQTKEKKVPKNSAQEISPVDAEMQADIVTGHKRLVVEQERQQHEGIHLQDLAYETSQGAINHEKERQRQKHHHKNGQHSVHRKVSREENVPEVEEKLFSEDPVKEQAPKTRPVLEDAFEAISTEKVHKDSFSKKHSKKPKHKKAHEKSKTDKHFKKSKEDKKGKDKKEKQKREDKKSKKAW